MQYLVFLGGMLLPVPPEQIITTINNRNSTVDLINDGEVNIIRNAGLTDISFTFMVPKHRYPFAIYDAGFLTQAVILEFVEKLKTNNEPFTLIITRGINLPTNMLVTLEDYTITEDANNGEDFYINVNLKKYVPYATKKINSDGKVVRVRP